MLKVLGKNSVKVFFFGTTEMLLQKRPSCFLGWKMKLKWWI